VKPKCEICRKPANAGQLVIPVLTYMGPETPIDNDGAPLRFVHLTCVETTRRMPQ
jgi:hypothetical protein